MRGFPKLSYENFVSLKSIMIPYINPIAMKTSPPFFMFLFVNIDNLNK